MLKNFTSNRLQKFSTEQKDIYNMGVEIFRQHRYENTTDPKKRAHLSAYATGNLTEKKALFNKAMKSFASRVANLPDGIEFNDATMVMNPNARWATFAVISELLDTLVPETVLDEFQRFAEVKNVNWGDQLLFENPNNDLFVVTTQANNNRKTTRQRLFTNDLTMQPVNHAITVGEHWYRVVTGQADFALLVTRAVESMQAKIARMVYDAIVNSYNTLEAEYKEEGVFNARTFNTMRQRVLTANGGGRASAFGTQVALSQIVPDQAGFQFGMGEEYNRNGYLGSFQGTNLFELTQRLVPGTNDFALDETMVLIMSSLNEQIVKIGFEGTALAFEQTSPQSADLGHDWTLQQRFDVKLVDSGKYGIYKITEA